MSNSSIFLLKSQLKQLSNSDKELWAHWRASYLVLGYYEFHNFAIYFSYCFVFLSLVKDSPCNSCLTLVISISPHKCFKKGTSIILPVFYSWGT